MFPVRAVGSGVGQTDSPFYQGQTVSLSYGFDRIPFAFYT